MLLTLIVFIFILGLLIFVHELGHFVMAKRSGIKVEEFAFGFPPRLWAIKKGETEYAINWLPFGGYVRMLGESETEITTAEKNNPRSFAQQSVWIRSKVLVAGVIMNFILGWVLISFGYMIGISPIVTNPAQIPFAHQSNSVVIAGVLSGSVAQTIGLKPGDIVTQIQGTIITNRDQMAEVTKSLKGQAVALQISRKGKVVRVNGTLSNTDAPLGVQLADDVKVRLPVWFAPLFGALETVKAAGLIFTGVIGFFKDIVVHRTIPEEASGPVGIFVYTRTVIDLGFGALLNFIAILSINLGIINILPIPALDGGRLLFVILEKVNKGKKLINSRIENLAHTIGFALLILMIIAITYKDILHLTR